MLSASGGYLKSNHTKRDVCLAQEGNGSMPASNRELVNWEILVWALYLLGADSGLIDIEDAYVKCFEIAPNRFSWRTKPYPDSKKCNKALQEAEIRDPKLLTKTTDGWKRQLTVEGQEWVKNNTHRIGKLLGRDHVVQEPKQRPAAKLLIELERSVEYNAWHARGVMPQEKWKFAELLHCSSDSDISVWRNRIEMLRSTANKAGKKKVLQFLDEVVKCFPEWFSGGY